MEKGSPQAVGRARSKRGSPPDRGTGTSANGLRGGHLLGPSRATFQRDSGESFQATLISVDGRKVPTSRDFDSASGTLKDPSLLLLNESEANDLLARIRNGDSRVLNVEDKPYTTRPYAPFTTSTLQQEANRKYGFTARTTMQVAQSLYENGHITYMRTDSTNLASVAVEAARDLVQSQYGSEYLPPQPRVYQTKVKNAQEAHEAIRPAGPPLRSSRETASLAHQRRVPPLRPDLETNRGQPDGGCPRPPNLRHRGVRRRPFSR